MSRPGLPAGAVVQHRRYPRPGGRVVRVVLVAGVAVMVALATSALKIRPPAPPTVWVSGPTVVQVMDESTVDGEPPTRLRVPAIGLDAPLERLGLDSSGVLAAPLDFARPGWYADGTRPGEPGPAVIAGHVDSTRGPAIFYRLRELTPGDVILVARGTEWVTFHVVSSAWYPKARFPTAEVYGPTPDPQLRLITCGGTFDRTRRSYRENLVVYAVGGP